jgi:adenylate kinase family enzyme
MKYLKKYELFEKKEEKKFTGENRIILLGPPAVGKSTISKALGEKLDLEVISLDMNQMKFGGFGEEEEVECVKWALSNKVNKPSILDFGGGHIYQENAKDLIKGYKNIFVLIPSEDYDFSQELLKSSTEVRLNLFFRVPIKHILKSLESDECEFSDIKRKKLISITKKIIGGGAGKLKVNDIPKASLDKFGDMLKGGFESAPNWDNYSNLYTKKHDKINRSITDNIIEVFTESGNRRSVSSIVNEIIRKCK